MNNDLAKLIRAEPPENVIKKRNGFDYLEAWWVIKRLNEIFGEDCVSPYFDDVRLLAEGTHNDKSFATYSVRCSLTIDMGGAGHVVKTDMGSSTQIGANIGANHENAIKGACSDALKRAARHLGAQFGLKLYDTDNTGSWGDGSLSDGHGNNISERNNICEKENKPRAPKLEPRQWNISKPKTLRTGADNEGSDAQTAVDLNDIFRRCLSTERLAAWKKANQEWFDTIEQTKPKLYAKLKESYTKAYKEAED